MHTIWTEIKRALTSMFVHWSILLAIYLAIDLLWQGLEDLFIGEAQPSAPDAIIGAILAYSIYRHLRISVTFNKLEAHNEQD